MKFVRFVMKNKLITLLLICDPGHKDLCAGINNERALYSIKEHDMEDQNIETLLADIESAYTAFCITQGMFENANERIKANSLPIAPIVISDIQQYKNFVVEKDEWKARKAELEVCYYTAQSARSEAIKNLIDLIPMREMWFAVQGGFVGFFLYLRKRAKRVADAELDTEWSELQTSPRTS